MEDLSGNQQPNMGGRANDYVGGGGNSNGDSTKESMKRWEQKLSDKLYLLSFDLIELNVFYNFFTYCIFIALETIFIIYFPLNHIYNDFVVKTVSASQDPAATQLQYTTKILYNSNFEHENRDIYAGMVAQYLNLGYLLTTIHYELYVSVLTIVCHVLLVIFAAFAILLITRETGTINLSSQRKFITKLYSFLLITLIKTLQVPLLAFLFHIYACDGNQVAIEQDDASLVSSYCYQGTHLEIVVYATIITFLYYTLAFYFYNMLSLSYPHEKVPWAALPTKLPLIRECCKFFLVLVYSETNMSHYVIAYANIVVTLGLLVIVNQRLTSALIFHTTIYKLQIVMEALLFVIFLFAFLRDFVSIDRNFVFHLLWIISSGMFSIAALFYREQLRYKFLSKVDFALYENPFEALVMMFTLHELIESSAYDDKEDFILRGFIERHIEICEYPSCSCTKYYSVCNSVYRLELAQMSPFSKNYDSSSMNHTAQNATGHSYVPESEVDDLSTLKVFYGRQMS